MSTSHDPGLAPARTELAWRRTLLAMAAGALVSVRVLPPVLGDWTIATGIGGVLAAAVLWILVRRRQAPFDVVLRGDAPASALPGGGVLLALAGLTAAGASLGLLAALLSPR